MGEVVDFVAYKRRLEARLPRTKANPTPDDFLAWLYGRIDQLDPAADGNVEITVTMTANEWIVLTNDTDDNHSGLDRRTA